MLKVFQPVRKLLTLILTGLIVESLTLNLAFTLTHGTVGPRSAPDPLIITLLAFLKIVPLRQPARLEIGRLAHLLALGN